MATKPVSSTVKIFQLLPQLKNVSQAQDLPVENNIEDKPTNKDQNDPLVENLKQNISSIYDRL